MRGFCSRRECIQYLPSVEGKVRSLEWLSFGLPRQPVAPCGWQQSHAVDLVDTKTQKKQLHDDVDDLDPKHLTSCSSALEFREYSVRLRDGLDGILESAFRQCRDIEIARQTYSM